MENVTNEFLASTQKISEEEANARSLEAVRSLGLSADEELKFVEHLSNGRASDEEEAAYERQLQTRSVTRAASTFSDSPLVKYTCLSPNCNSPRGRDIDTITIHEVWGQCTMKQLGDIFLPWSRQASSNYGVCTDGIALFVHERDRAWTSGSTQDYRAVTIETSNSRTYPNPVDDDVYERLIQLCVDICLRNGKKKMVWCGSLAKTNKRTFAPDEMRMTLHKWFQATDCPGSWLEGKMKAIAKEVNKRIEEEEKGMFTDVDKDDKFYHVYAKMVELGIFKKDAKGRFNPKKKVTRMSIAIMFFRLLRYLGKIK